MLQFSRVLLVLATLFFVSHGFFFPDEFILTAVNGISKYSIDLSGKVLAVDAFEAYVDSIPRNITQVDINSFVSAFGNQLTTRIANITNDMHSMSHGYSETCTPTPDDPAIFDHFGIDVYDGVATYGASTAEFRERAHCALDAVPHMPTVQLPLIDENDYTSWTIAPDASETHLTWTPATPRPAVVMTDAAVMWKRVVDARSGAVAIAPAPAQWNGFHDARESAAFINGASAVLPRAAGVVIDPFINNAYATKDLPRLYSNMFHLARTVLMSLGDSDGMTIHSTDGRYVGDNTFLATADAQHNAITRGLHPATWYRRMDMLKNLQAYFADVAAAGYTADTAGLQLDQGRINPAYNRDLLSAITRVANSFKHSISATEHSTSTRYVLKPEAPAYLYILTTVPQVDATFGYDLRKLLLDCGVGIIPVFIDVRSTLPAQAKSPWETVKGYFSMSEPLWNRALCDISARTVTPDLMFDFQVDPFIDSAAEYLARTKEYLEYPIPTKENVLNSTPAHRNVFFDILVELVVMASETAHALAVKADPSASEVVSIRMEMALDSQTRRQVLELAAPVFIDGELDAVMVSVVDIMSFIFHINIHDLSTEGYPFNAQASIYDTKGRLFFNSMLASARLTDQDSLDLLDPEELEGWVDGGFVDALDQAVEGQYGTHIVEATRQITGLATVAVRTRYVFQPLGDLLLVTSWPDHYVTRITLRPDLSPMGWCPATYSGDIQALLREYSGKACFDPQVFALTTIGKGDPGAAAYQSMMELDADFYGNTYASYFPRDDTLNAAHRDANLEDVTWANAAPFFDYSDKASHPTPARSLDWIMTDKAMGDLQTASILGAGWRHAYTADPGLSAQVTFINSITIDGGFMYSPNTDFLSSLGLATFGSLITKTYFHGAFTSSKIVYTDPYPSYVSGVLANVGRRVHLNDRGYARPWISASFALSLNEAADDIVGATTCGHTVEVDGENYYIDCFVLTQNAHVALQNDVDVLKGGIVMAPRGVVDLSAEYPALFDFLVINGIYVKRSVIDFATLKRVESFQLAETFGVERKMIIDGGLVSANCTVGTQMEAGRFEIVRLDDPTLLNRHIAACRLPGHDTLFVLTENVTISSDRFVSQTFQSADVTLKSTPMFNVVLDTIKPAFVAAEPSVVDPSVFQTTSGLKTGGTCSITRRAAPAEVIAVIVASVAIVVSVLACMCLRLVFMTRQSMICVNPAMAEYHKYNAN